MSSVGARRPGTLTIDDDRVEQGSFLTFDYTVAGQKAGPKNWIGIWPDPGDGPTDGEYVGPQISYEYAPGRAGQVTMSSGMLRAGDYLAFYLHDDGYTSLARPVGFTVRPGRQLPPPAYRSDFGNDGPHRLDFPTGIAVDRAGRFWVADPGSRCVHRFDRRGRGSGSIGAGLLRDPQDVTTDGRRVYVADAERSSVEVFGYDGRHRGSIGADDLDRPRGVAVGPGGRLLVADVGHNRVARFDLTGGPAGELTTDVHIPHGIAVHGERVWVVSSSRQYDGDPGITCFVGDRPTITLGYGQHSVFGGLSNPAHVAVDRAGHVLVSVPDFGIVSRFEPTGPFRGEFGTSGPGLLRHPHGVAIGPGGDIYVVDTGNGRVVRFGVVPSGGER